MIIFLRGEGKFLGDEKGGGRLENGFNKINTPSSTSNSRTRKTGDIITSSGLRGRVIAGNKAGGSRRDSFLLHAGSLPPSPLSLVPNILSFFLSSFCVFQYEFNPRNAGNGTDSCRFPLHEINAFNLSTLGRGKCDGSMKQGFNRDG